MAQWYNSCLSGRNKYLFMKKLLITTFSILLVHLTFAQHAHFGIKGGVNLSTLKNNDAYKYKTGFHAGVFSHIHLAKHVALQPELLYSSQGTESKSTLVDLRYNLGYLNLPVMFQYMFNNGFRLETGPQASLLVSAKQKINSIETDIKDDLNSFDFGWGFGLGYISKSNFGIDARYNLGLTAVNEIGTTDLKNSVFQIGVFYQFKGR